MSLLPDGLGAGLSEAWHDVSDGWRTAEHAVSSVLAPFRQGMQTIRNVKAQARAAVDRGVHTMLDAARRDAGRLLGFPARPSSTRTSASAGAGGLPPGYASGTGYGPGLRSLDQRYGLRRYGIGPTPQGYFDDQDPQTGRRSL